MEHQTLRAAAWMIGSILSFTTMAVAGREVGGELDTFEIMFFRSVIGVLIVLALGTATGTIGQVRTRRLKVHATRNVCHFVGQNLWFYAITVAPLAQVFALEFTMPIWVLALSVLVLGERLTPIRVACALLGFCGILVITRPWSTGIGPGIVPAASAAICFAGSAVLTRFLSRTETITCIMFWLTLMQAVMGLVCAGWDMDIALPSARGWPLVALIGVCGLVAHFCLTRAVSLAPATVVTPVDFARLPIIAIVGLMLYGEPLDPPVLIGALVIFAANYLNIWAETRRRAVVA